MMDCSPAQSDVNVPGSGDQDKISGLVVDLVSLYDYLARLENRRDPRGVRYRLVHILIFVLLAKLAWEDRLSAIAEWVWHRKEGLPRPWGCRAPRRRTARLTGGCWAPRCQLKRWSSASPGTGPMASWFK